MNYPELYLSFESFSNQGSEALIKKYFKLGGSKKDGETNVLDIGCGPGNITQNVVVPIFKNCARKMVGIDVSQKMIDFGNATYGNDWFSFKVCDLEKETPQEFISYFDYVFSFWALQWIQDQRQLYKNIYKIMKPGGHIFLTYIAQSKLYDIYQSVWHKPEYAPYITNFQQAQSCFQKSKDPKKELEVFVKEAGFDVNMIKIETVQLNSSFTDFKNFLASISPVSHQIPENLREKFLMDHVQEVDRNPGAEPPNDYCMVFDLFVVYAKKN